MPQLTILYVTHDNEQALQNIATELLQKKLIVCANISPMTSLYSWQDKIEHQSEYAMFAKTMNHLLEEAIEAIKVSHSFEVPCILSWKSDAQPAYMDWSMSVLK